MKNQRFGYFCNQCGKEIENISDIYITSEKSTAPFCSEDCIVEHYSREIEFFSEKERSIREQFQLGEESLEGVAGQVRETIENYTEAWMDKNELGLEYYTLFHEVEHEGRPVHIILITLFYDGRPSVILHHTRTLHSELLRYYRKGKLIKGTPQKVKSLEDIDEGSGHAVEDETVDKEELVLPQVVIERIENLRSVYLADYLKVRGETDIPMEKFSYYDNCIEPCITEPDEVCEFIDKSGSVLNTHIKSFSYAPEDSFFYFVICLKLEEKYKDEGGEEDDVLIPVLSFPSTSSDIYSYFRKGDMITRRSVN
jgi:hypothetical protein